MGSHSVLDLLEAVPLGAVHVFADLVARNRAGRILANDDVHELLRFFIELVESILVRAGGLPGVKRRCENLPVELGDVGPRLGWRGPSASSTLG